jgi:iron complex outermembrane receptor protein
VSQAIGIGLLASMASTAGAQSASQTVEKIEVTGSNIKRVEAETASPVQIITAVEMARSGKTNVADYLQTLTVDGAGSLPTGFGNGFAAGSTAISIRGLGATSTLVLLNGRRMAAYARADDGQKTFTDLSTVPMEAVERIEILKDGASSIYGADAIAGVVNIILKKDFSGVTIKGSYGSSRYHDYNQSKGSITAGTGSLGKEGYNLLFNAEIYKTDELYNKDRWSRDYIGHGDLRAWGFPIGTQFASGYIAGVNSASASPVGLIRNPATTAYQALPGCASLSLSSPQDPNGGCVWHQDQFRSMQPKVDGFNLFGRGTWQVNADTQFYAEVGYSERKAGFHLVPPTFNPTVAFPPNAASPTGVIVYGNTVLMAASHPQNPFGAAARIRYSAFDIGPQNRVADNSFTRMVAGFKGSAWGWEYDTGILHSESKLNLDWSNVLNMKVVQAALGDPTSQFFPYFLGSQAYKNPASLYAAMVRHSTSDSTTKLDSIDFKASRELMDLAGGPMSLAVGAEYRKESLDNPSLSGSEDGSVNISYVAAKGDNKISAVYAELLAPVTKWMEVSGAFRYDKYDHFNSTTPKLGLKITPVKEFAVRATYSEGFRAPGPAEASASSQSTGNSTVADPVRCPNGTTPLPGATSTDCAISIGAVKVGDPSLKPEKSKGYTLGFVWDATANTSIAVDNWRIKRTDEINPLPYNEAARLPTAIRLDNNLTINGVVVPNTGTLLLSKAPYKNSSYTEIKGTDFDVKQRFNLGDYGKLIAALRWTHVSSWVRAESDTVKYQFAGTHGNCDTSNCAGTPKDKVNLALSWDYGAWNWTSTINYRGKMDNKLFEGNPCASIKADGSGFCTIDSFTTVDLSAAYNVNKQLQVFGSITNLFDKVAPLDPLTYGGISYNPMDASGAIGRYFRIGARYQF